MPGDGQLRYDTELKTRPDYWKFRRAPPPESQYRSLFYKNDWNTFAKSLSGLSVGSILGTGFTGAAVCYENQIASHLRFRPKHFAEKFVKIGVPFIIAGLSYGVTVGLATNIRKKEDPVNHFLGGVVGASLYTNYYTKSWRVKTCVGLAAGVTCAAIKYCKDTQGESLIWTFDARPPSVEFRDYRHVWFGERRNPEGSDDATKDTQFYDGTVNARNIYP